jgi:arylsulfatase A-like enzyme
MKRTIVLLSVLFVGCSVLFAKTTEQPNVIMVLVDDMGWGDVGYNGHPHIKTPNIDKMAANGLRMDRFYSTCATCSPSRASILTGRHNLRLGLTGYMETPSDQNPGSWHLLESEITYAEALRDAGYATAHYGKWHVGYMCKEQSPEHYLTPGMAGFDDWFTSHNVVNTYDPYASVPYAGTKFVKDEKHLYFDNGKFISMKEGKKRPELRIDDATIVMNKTIAFIEQSQKQGKPFAIAVWLHHVHAPLTQNPGLEDLYPDLPKLEVLYNSNVSAIDIEIGRLRAKLRELGIADNTMLWFTSDNGPVGPTQQADQLKNHSLHDGRFKYGHRGSSGPYRGGKYNLWEGGIRVPCAIEWPARIKAGGTTDFAGVTSDYLPTVLAAANVPLPSDREYDGISLLPLFDGKVEKRGVSIPFSTGRQRAYMDDRYKIVSDKKKPVFDQLYDLKKDPYEENNLAPMHPERFERMVAEYEKWEQEALTDWTKMLEAEGR